MVFPALHNESVTSTMRNGDVRGTFNVKRHVSAVQQKGKGNMARTCPKDLKRCDYWICIKGCRLEQVAPVWVLKAAGSGLPIIWLELM